MSRLDCFLIQEVVIIANVKPFHTKSVMNKPQAEGKVNSRVKSRAQEKKDQHSSAIKKQNNEAQLLVYLKSFFLISMIELDHQRSAAKTLVNKMGLDTFVFFFSRACQ